MDVRQVEVTRWYLEQRDPGELRPAAEPAEPVDIVRAEPPGPEFGRFLYTAVGADWYWTDRLPWSRERWASWLDRPGCELWVAYVRGTPAGYAELDARPDGQVEIAYFGLLPGFLGRGLGGHLLTVATRRAWDLAARRPGFDDTRHDPKGSVKRRECSP